MKKTITTVAALALGFAASASAAALTDAAFTFTNPAATNTLTGIGSTFSVTTTITGSDFADLLAGKDIAKRSFFSVALSPAHSVGIGTDYSSNNSKIVSSGMYIKYSNNGSYVAGTGEVANASNGGYTAAWTGNVNGATDKNLGNLLGDFDMSNVTGLALTLTFSKSAGTKLYFTSRTTITTG